jgi:hypothetical protein
MRRRCGALAQQSAPLPAVPPGDSIADRVGEEWRLFPVSLYVRGRWHRRIVTARPPSGKPFGCL